MTGALTIILGLAVGAAVGFSAIYLFQLRREHRMLARLRHPTSRRPDATGTLTINGVVAATFVPVAIPPGGGAEMHVVAVHDDHDGTAYLVSIEATTVTGPPDEEDGWVKFD